MDGSIRTSTLTITPTILRLIAEIDEFKGAWTAIGRISPERLVALTACRHHREHRFLDANRGGKADRQRSRASALPGLDVKKFASRDEEEIAGYAETMKTVFVEHSAAIPLTENHIKQLHGDLLQYSSKDARHRGEYKTHNNHVEAFGPDGESLGIVFETATPFDTPRLMSELVKWTQENFDTKDLHALIYIALFIVVFLEIHPFQDGNGRLSRILTTLLLLHAGYDYASYSSLESVIEQSKDAYYRSLRQTQSTIRTDSPNWQPWLETFS